MPRDLPDGGICLTAGFASLLNWPVRVIQSMIEYYEIK